MAVVRLPFVCSALHCSLIIHELFTTIIRLSGDYSAQSTSIPEFLKSQKITELLSHRLELALSTTRWYDLHEGLKSLSQEGK